MSPIQQLVRQAIAKSPAGWSEEDKRQAVIAAEDLAVLTARKAAGEAVDDEILNAAAACKAIAAQARTDFLKHNADIVNRCDDNARRNTELIVTSNNRVEASHQELGRQIRTVLDKVVAIHNKGLTSSSKEENG